VATGGAIATAIAHYCCSPGRDNSIVSSDKSPEQNQPPLPGWEYVSRTLTGDEIIDANTEDAEFMPLVHLDILWCLCLGDQLQDPTNSDSGTDGDSGTTGGDIRHNLSIYHKMTAVGIWFAWGLSDDVNAAIECYHRVARADEEGSLGTAEARFLSR
jgi:hypothetical protein